MELGKVADKVADTKKKKKKSGRHGFHMVADMEVDKVADFEVDMDMDININMEIQWSQGLVNWDQTFSTRSLPSLRIF